MRPRSSRSSRNDFGRGENYFPSRRVVTVRTFSSLILLLVSTAMTIGMKPVRHWRREIIASVSRYSSSFVLLPMADAFVSQRVGTKRSETVTASIGSFFDAQSKRSISRFHSSSFSVLSAVVVPELDDSFPDDYSSQNNRNNTEGYIPPIAGEDYFPGVGFSARRYAAFLRR